MVWPVTLLATLGFGWLCHIALPLQQNFENWLELDLYWSHGAAQWPPILLGIPLFALFITGIVLIFRVSAIAFKAIVNGWL
jgi:hypothetical protein